MMFSTSRRPSGDAGAGHERALYEFMARVRDHGLEEWQEALVSEHLDLRETFRTYAAYAPLGVCSEEAPYVAEEPTDHTYAEMVSVEPGTVGRARSSALRRDMAAVERVFDHPELREQLRVDTVDRLGMEVWPSRVWGPEVIVAVMDAASCVRTALPSGVSVGDCRAFVRYSIDSLFDRQFTATFYDATGLCEQAMDSLLERALASDTPALLRFEAIRVLLNFFP